MQEVRIFAWCNHCWTDGEQKVEATDKFVIAIDTPGGRSTQPREVDLCDLHAKPVRELKDLVLKTGALVSPKDGPVSAPVKAAKVPKVTEPKVVEPQLPLPEVKPRKGPAPKPGRDERPCPICGKVMARASVLSHMHATHGCRKIGQPKKCPDCGRQFNLPRLLIVHRGLTHGYDYWAEVAATAKHRR